MFLMSLRIKLRFCFFLALFFLRFSINLCQQFFVFFFGALRVDALASLSRSFMLCLLGNFEFSSNFSFAADPISASVFCRDILLKKLRPSTSQAKSTCLVIKRIFGVLHFCVRRIFGISVRVSFSFFTVPLFLSR